MVDLGHSGLRPCQIKKAVNAIKPSYEPDVTSKQCVDILAEQRKQYRDMFDDGSPRNIFWADGRSRDDYIKFGDVVVFDVTYMTNKFKLPFAPFVGVNHHGQSIILGGALLENEKEETFRWLFEHFLKCMFDRHPSTILTDQDKAICNAVYKVFPNSRHRYCSWHFNKHELEHLRPFRAHYTDFQECYRRWVKSRTIEEFETQWDVIREKYKLHNSSWMMEMYNQRKYWVNAFFKDTFLAGMTTSGRSESIHAFFDGYVNSKTMLNEFVIQYDKAVASRRAAEEDEDFRTMNSRPNLSSIHPIEAKAGKCYTKMMFEVFKKEWIQATNNLSHETLSKSQDHISYRVGQVDVEKKYWRTVNFCLLDYVNVQCSCAKFETDGILCKHILYVMKKKNVETLPDHFILPRWTIDVRYKVSNGNIGLEMNSEQEVSAFHLWCVHGNCTKAIEQAKDSPDEIKKLNSFLVKFLEDRIIRKKPPETKNAYKDPCVQISQIDIMPQISIRDPPVLTKTKGRPKVANRIKSSLEVKRKKCSFCGELGHNITGCSQNIKKARAFAQQQNGLHQG